MSDAMMREAAGLVDTIYNLREQVRDHELVISQLKADAAIHEDRLRLLVEGTGMTEIAGSVARAKFGIKSVPQVVDWQEVYAYIQQTGAFELLHKRLGAKAWEERINAGVNVPGVVQVVLPDVQIRGKR